MEEYGLVMLLWLTEEAVLIHDVGANCENILVKIFDIVGKGHDYLVLACERTVGV